MTVNQIVKKEKEIHTSLAVAPQTAKATAVVSEKCLVKTEKALNLWVKNMNRKCVPTATCLCQKAWSLHQLVGFCTTQGFRHALGVLEHLSIKETTAPIMHKKYIPAIFYQRPQIRLPKFFENTSFLARAPLKFPVTDIWNSKYL